ncbi:SDR family NAD(P)-dependent oxidoreductase [Caenimonas aquaedulcis]|uniref:SDR family NAD(P)-dependent oxidoreductase n=1 Tax=Caenimonas aquaedulcis TaxID=2793270 RepID=A0A931H6N6_9BURK|nr:SDR family NAD(P)-dependent oxidoreductase [Caenimonas aquaedulcis]MBG9389576.1 SDR family NAD(P)-dependent oxidoreductase [Caenimonas aquaedulcis]
MTFPRLLPPLNPPVDTWQGCRVWLVGASSGIGRAAASALHARGAQVHVSGRNAQALDDFVAAHPGARAWPLDVRNTTQVARAADRVRESGPLDMMVFCAAYYQGKSIADFDLQDMLEHQAVNYAGALGAIGAVLPAMLREGHGHISLLASVAGYRGLPRSAAYGPTKAALIHLAETMYLELHGRGLGVSVVNPGFVDTPMTAKNDFAMPAMIGPAEAAHRMILGWERGHFEIHFPRRFTWPMKLLARLPFRLYQALVRRGTGT